VRQKSRRHPFKSAPSRGKIWTAHNTQFPGPTRVHTPNGIWIGSTVFAWLSHGRYKQRYTPVCNNWSQPPHLASAAMWRKIRLTDLYMALSVSLAVFALIKTTRKHTKSKPNTNLNLNKRSIVKTAHTVHNCITQ